MTWSERYPEYCSMIEAALPQYLPPVTLPQGKVCEAMAYSLLDGGKRIRGCLTLAMRELWCSRRCRWPVPLRWSTPIL